MPITIPPAPEVDPKARHLAVRIMEVMAVATEPLTVARVKAAVEASGHPWEQDYFLSDAIRAVLITCTHVGVLHIASRNPITYEVNRAKVVVVIRP